MTNFNNLPSNSQQQTSTRYDSAEQTRSFQNSMLELWKTMTRLYHPQWVRTNGEIGGGIFQDWTRELMPYGAQGVLRGINAVRESGNVYMPNLNKFAAECRSGSHQKSGGEVDFLGRVPKPTPNGLPMCFVTRGNHTAAEMLASEHQEDQEVGAEMQRYGINDYQDYRKRKCLQVGVDYYE